MQSKDPKKAVERQVTWSHEKLKGGGCVQGWKAGEPFWVICHYMPPSLPCHFEMTEGELTCPYCSRRPRTEMIGYFPFRSLSGKPYVCVVQRYSADALTKIELHDPVKVYRGAEKGDPITVTLDRGRARYEPRTPDQRGPADIRAWLLTFWKDRVIADYFGPRLRCEAPPPPPSDNAVSPPASEERPRARVEGEVLEKWRAFVRGGIALDPPTVGESLPAVPEPSKNGKHRKPR